MAKGRNKPRVAVNPKSNQPRVEADPETFLKETPVWRFCDFDWEGPWGLLTCKSHIENLQIHISNHLASFESMTWEEILKAAGGKGEGKGNNSHAIPTSKFKKAAIERLREKGITAEDLFSLRLDAGTRLYGVRQGRCLRLVFFDPHHKEKMRAAYNWD